LAVATACGVAIQAQAHSPAEIHLAQVKERDLKPVPGSSRRPKVSLRPSAAVVPVGSPITFQVRSSVRGYGHLYVMSASGRAQVWMENVPIAAGRRLLFPIGGIGIKAAPPAGRDDIMLIVTKRRIDGFFGYRTTRWPRVVDYDHESFKEELTEKFSDMPKREWGYARTSVRVVDRRSPPGEGWGWGSKKDREDYWADQWEDDD
jgi:hypothetical protein